MELVVERQPHRRHSAVLSTVVKATVASVESVAGRSVGQAVLHQHLKLSSDSGNETVAVIGQKEEMITLDFSLQNKNRLLVIIWCVAGRGLELWEMFEPVKYGSKVNGIFIICE